MAHRESLFAPYFDEYDGSITKLQLFMEDYLVAIARGSGKSITKVTEDAIKSTTPSGNTTPTTLDLINIGFQHNVLDVSLYPGKMTYNRTQRFNFSYPFFIDTVVLAYRKHREQIYPDIFAAYANPFDAQTWICTFAVVFGILCVAITRGRQGRTRVDAIFDALEKIVVGVILALYSVTFTVKEMHFRDLTERPEDGLAYATARILDGSHRLLLTSVTLSLGELVNQSIHDDVIAFRSTFATHPPLIESDPLRACALLADPMTGGQRLAFLNFRSYLLDNCAENMNAINIVSVPELPWTLVAYFVADKRAGITKSLDFSAVHGLFNAEFERFQRRKIVKAADRRIKLINPAVFFPVILLSTGLLLSLSVFVAEQLRLSLTVMKEHAKNVHVLITKFVSKLALP